MSVEPKILEILGAEIRAEIMLLRQQKSRALLKSVPFWGGQYPPSPHLTDHLLEDGQEDLTKATQSGAVLFGI